MGDILAVVYIIYIFYACWFHGWIIGCDRELRPQPPFWVQTLVALLWPLIVWNAYKKWRAR